MWVVDSVDVDTRAVNKISKFSQDSEKAAILYVFSLKGHLLNKCGLFYTRIVAKFSLTPLVDTEERRRRHLPCLLLDGVTQHRGSTTINMWLVVVL